MNDSIKVTVIIPTYGRNAYLKRAIDSVVAQTYKNIEIIVINDNPVSSAVYGDVVEICEYYTNKANIRLVKTKGREGGGCARNIGCQNATGEYLAFLDDDDVYLPNKIEKQLEFTINNGLDMSFQDIVWLNEKEEIVEYRKFSYIKDFSNENLLKEHLLHNIAPTSIYFIKTSLFRQTKGFGNLKVGQDIYLMFECILNDFKIGYMQGAYVNQYLHTGKRISTGRNKIEGENWWYKEKQQYLYILNKKEKRFFRFRHYIILFFACIRSHFWTEALKYGVFAFFNSPQDSFVEAYKYLSGKKSHKKRLISYKG